MTGQGESTSSYSMTDDDAAAKLEVRIIDFQGSSSNGAVESMTLSARASKGRVGSCNNFEKTIETDSGNKEEEVEQTEEETSFFPLYTDIVAGRGPKHCY